MVRGRHAQQTVKATLEAVVALVRARTRGHPILVLLVTNLASLVLALSVASRSSGGLRGLLIRAAVRAAKATPGVRGHVARMKSNMRERIERMVIKDLGESRLALPEVGMTEVRVSAQLSEWATSESSWRQGKVSGTVYSGDDGLTRLMADAFRLYALSNPLHPDVFPSVRKMEAEVVSMVAQLFNPTPTTCGTMTSGGTESILLACKAHRDTARETRGVFEPEIIVPSTAHAAFLKAAHYLAIKCIRVPVHPTTFRADVRAMAKLVGPNTVMLVGSAPCFPQGVIDPIAELAELALSAGVGLHVDCCLGSLLLPMMGRLGVQVPPFDFALAGVTSLSCDTHKYGFAPKGTAVILYANEELRHAQYHIAGDWSGGIYATPTLSGSRSGALIAGTWAVMVRMGEKGYLAAFERILSATRAIEEGVRSVAELEILGSVDTSVVCFGSKEGARGAGGKKKLNILNVGDAMSAKGWALNSLQHPPCLHLCVCLPHAAPGVAERFVDDLRASVLEVSSAPAGRYSDGVGALYGMAETIRESSVVDELARTFIDALYKV